MTRMNKRLKIHVSLSVIGKGGEQIAAIQSETQCMVQFATGQCFYVQTELFHHGFRTTLEPSFIACLILGVEFVLDEFCEEFANTTREAMFSP